MNISVAIQLVLLLCYF